MPEYREIAGFPGYRVGDDGSVWSCLLKVRSGQCRGFVFVISESWRQLHLVVQRDGHLRVSLCKNGSVYQRSVHRLVLEAFVGPCPSRMEACHFPDRDPTNNNLSNLRWDTHSSNAFDAVAHGTHVDNRGEKHPMAKLDYAKAGAIRAARTNGVSRRALAAAHGVCVTTIDRILGGRAWHEH